MSTRRQRQILRNKKLEFQRTMEENLKKPTKKKTKKTPKEEK